MDNFTRGISNLTGPDPNRLFSSYTSAAGGGKSKKKKKGKKKPKVGAFSSPEDVLPFIEDILKFLKNACILELVYSSGQGYVGVRMQR